MSNEEKSKKENSSKKTIIIVVAIITLIILITFIVITIINKNSSRELKRENNNYQAKYYGNFYGNEIKKIALFYYLNNNKMISSNELEEAIKNIEDHNFTGSEIKFSDIKCKSMKTEENGDLKLIDCNSDLFNSKKGYTYETNIIDEINSLTYSDIDSSYTENSVKGLAKIRNFNINIEYSTGCDYDEKDGMLKEVDYNSSKYVKVKRNNEVVDSDTINENDEVDVRICKKINLDNIDKKIDVSTINLNNKLSEKDFTPKKLEEVAETIDEASFDTEYKYKYDNGIFYIKDNNNYSKEYNNVKKVYYHRGSSCGYYIELFIMTEDKIYLLILDGTAAILEKEIYQNESYDSIYSVFVHSLTCGAEYKFVAHKSDNTFYNLKTNKQLDMTIKYNYYDILTTDRRFNDYDTKLTTKAVIKDNVVNAIKYIIDSNDYLYGYIHNNDSISFEKLDDRKVKTIYYNEKEKYLYIQFMDEAFYDDNIITNVGIDY